ncbi:MAG TPA: hypothetical protein VK121_04620 [Pseudogracilibacillus sp.]|nr:hypothetical protein [Pseudogracilibacillus sp.]
MKKVLFSFLSAVILLPSVFMPYDNFVNAEGENGEESVTADSEVLDEELIKKLNDYVSLNGNLKYTVDKKEAKENLSEEEYDILIDTVDNTNKEIKEIDESEKNVNNSDDITVEEIEYVDPKKEDFNSNKNRLAYKEGVTKLETHWWGLRVYLSKTSVEMISGGVAIGGIWVPEPTVSKVLSTLGIVAGTFVPGGVVFDLNPIPPHGVPTNIHFQ